MRDDAYLTIEKDVEEVVFKELGSKFINYAFYVRNEEEVKQKLDYLYERWPDATHHCYAYILGIDRKNYRANDDGEPSGSAGLPIYNQLLSAELTNILVVSVRYFGGTKLGVPGLVKAYKYAAQLAIENAEIITRYLTKSAILEFNYDQQGIVERNIERVKGEIINREFTEKCRFTVEVRASLMEEFKNQFDEMYQLKFTELDD
ncbi:IMPACT family protein [Vaginella massiliensis]|uniref:IMPACT family protein n=1 Tax=Vaginella massiliensis TaxID=1816680 RepID=UPI003751400D